jgi:predicted RNA binding protein YcfA (HicA-like mRNA interferase family)
MNFKEIEKIIKTDGWKLVGVCGSHHQYKHPIKSGKVTIPKHSGDIGEAVIKNILRQAKIE